MLMVLECGDVFVCMVAVFTKFLVVRLQFHVDWVALI